MLDAIHIIYSPPDTYQVPISQQRPKRPTAAARVETILPPFKRHQLSGDFSVHFTCTPNGYPIGARAASWRSDDSHSPGHNIYIVYCRRPSFLYSSAVWTLGWRQPVTIS